MRKWCRSDEKKKSVFQKKFYGIKRKSDFVFLQKKAEFSFFFSDFVVCCLFFKLVVCFSISRFVLLFSDSEKNTNLLPPSTVTPPLCRDGWMKHWWRGGGSVVSALVLFLCSLSSSSSPPSLNGEWTEDDFTPATCFFSWKLKLEPTTILFY